MSEKKHDNVVALHQIFGQNTKSSNEALKGLLETFLDLKIKRVEVKNSNCSMERLRNANLRLIVVVTLIDGIKNLVEVGVESGKEYEEVLSFYDFQYLFDVEGVKRDWLLSFLDHNRHVGESMVKVFWWAHENGEIIEELDCVRSVTVEHKKLKVSSFEKMDAKERYMYFLKNFEKKDDLIREILENDPHVQVLNKRLMECKFF